MVIGNGVTTIEYNAFYYCSSLTNITVSAENTAYQSIDGNLYSKDGTILIQYAIGKTATEFIIPEGVTTIGSYAFYNCDGLTSVEIPDSVIEIGSSAFSNCDGLTSVVIGDGVTEIGWHAFSSCGRLTSVVIGNGVTKIGDYAFAWCWYLETIIFEDTSTWYYTTWNSDYYYESDGTQIYVTDSNKNAEYFVEDYYEYCWFKL